MKSLSMDLKEVIAENSKPYMADVIINRALPFIDSMKPSHRKLLYTMYKMGLLKGNRNKSANIVGQTMKLNPHGDSSIYETLVRMTKDNSSLTIPYIDSKGNFGKVYSRDMQFAASRYTECKLSDISNMLFTDIDKNTVDFVDNYDGTTKEPALLPVAFPTILCNPNSGIAVGMATDILPLNMIEINNGVIHYLKTNKIDKIKESNFDFSTGGELLFNKTQHENIMTQGKGKIILRAKYEIDEKHRKILIKEIPYSTTTEAIEDSIIELVKQKKIKEISNIYDETDLKGLQIGIEYTRGTNVEILMNKLFKLTPLQTSMTANMNIITLSGRPKVMGVVEIVDEWLKFRRNCILRGLNFDLTKHKSKLHELNGLNKILLDIDKTIDIIKKSDNDENTKVELMKYFKIDEIQAKIVMDIKLKDLNKSYIKNKVDEIINLKKMIEEIDYQINNPKEIDNIIIKQLTEINKKYGIKRKTEIIYEYSTIKNMQVVEEYPAKLYLTKQNYIKKVKSNAIGDFKLKENDEIIKVIETNNKSDLYFLTNKGNAYKIQLDKIQLTSMAGLGEFIPNVVKIKDDEEIIDIFVIDDYKNGFIHTLYYDKNKRVIKMSKVSVEAYKSTQNRSKFVNCIDKNLEFICTNYSINPLKALTCSKNGRVNIFDSKNISAKKSKSASGNTITTDIELFKAMFVEENSPIEFKTKKGKDLRITLNDLFDENRSWYTYLSSKTARKGNYIINDRKDEIIELKIVE